MQSEEFRIDWKQGNIQVSYENKIWRKDMKVMSPRADHTAWKWQMLK